MPIQILAIENSAVRPRLITQNGRMALAKVKK